MCSRCRACDSILSMDEMRIKRKVKVGNGETKEMYEDLCGRCRGSLREVEEESEDINVLMDLED